MMTFYTKRGDAVSENNEVAMLRVLEQRCPGLTLPCRTNEPRRHDVVGDTVLWREITLVEYPINLSEALRCGFVDPCGRIVVRIIEWVRGACARMANAGVMHYDLHLKNIVLKWLGADTTCMPEVRIIDAVLSKDYTCVFRDENHVRVLPVLDALYDWYFFCFSMIQLYKLQKVPLPYVLVEEQAAVEAYRTRMDALGHEWSRVEAPLVVS